MIKCGIGRGPRKTCVIGRGPRMNCGIGRGPRVNCGGRGPWGNCGIGWGRRVNCTIDRGSKVFWRIGIGERVSWEKLKLNWYFRAVSQSFMGNR